MGAKPMSDREKWTYGFALAVTITAIIGIVILSALGRPTTDVLTVFGVAGLPVVGVMLGSMHSKTSEVAQNVNGRFSQMVELLARMSPPPNSPLPPPAPPAD